MKKKCLKWIGSLTIVICTIISIFLIVAQTKASDNTVLFLNHGYTIIDNVPTYEDYLFGGYFVEDETEPSTEDGYKPIKSIEGHKEGSYYAKFVPKDVLGIKAQVSENIYYDGNVDDAAENAIRFVTSIDSVEYEKIGFVLQKGNADPEIAPTTNYVYETLYYIGSTGADQDIIATNAGDVFCKDVSKYFKTFTITPLPADKFSTDITITPFWITLDGTTVYGTETIRTVEYCCGKFYVHSSAYEEGSANIGTHESPATLTTAVAIPVDERYVTPTIYLQDDITLSQQVQINKSLLLTSEGERKTIAREAQTKSSDALVYAKNKSKSITVTVDNVRFDGTGTEPNVRALAVGTESPNTTLNIKNSLIENFASSKAGGSLMVRGTVNFISSTIRGGNTTNGKGGLVYVDGGILNMRSGEMLSGEATNGGCVYVESGTFNMQSGKVSLGRATNGGCIYSSGGDVTISGGLIDSGIASTDQLINHTGNGGNIYIAAGILNISGDTTVISNGKAKSTYSSTTRTKTTVEPIACGGNILMAGGVLNVTGGTISGGEASTASVDYFVGNGGNIFSFTEVNISGETTTIYGGKTTSVNKSSANWYAIGGNICMAGSESKQAKLTIEDAMISDGNSAFRGGNINLYQYTTAILSGARLTGGTSINGGSIFVNKDSNLTIQKQTSISGGKASGEAGNIKFGGTGILRITDSTIFDGAASIDGGNISFAGEGSLIIKDSQILGGRASTDGGNINFDNTSGSLTIENSQIFEGRATRYGGNIYLNGQLSLAGGNVEITDGVGANGQASNLYLPSTQEITVDGKLTSNTSIGLTTFDGAYVFAKGSSIDKNCESYFFADASDKTVVYHKGTETNTLELVFKEAYTATDYLQDETLFEPVWASKRQVPEIMRDFDEKWQQFFTPNGRLMSVAHRGDWKNYPENSLEGFLSAILLGADVVEVDLAITKDGVIVAMHDGAKETGGTLTRTTNVAIARKNNPNLPESDNVIDWTYDELCHLRLREGKGGTNAPVTNCAIPTLAEVIQLCNERVFITLDKMDRLALLDAIKGTSLSSAGRFNEYLMPLMKTYNAYRTLMLPYSYTHVDATTANYDAKYQSVQTMLNNISAASGGVTSALMTRVETVEQLEQVMQYVKKYNFPLVLRSGEYSREDTVLYQNARAFDSFRVHIECLVNGEDGLRDNLAEWKEIYEAGYGIIVTNDIYGLTEYIQEMEFQSIHVGKDPVPGQGEDTGTWD